MKRIFALSVAALLFAGSAMAQDAKTAKDKAGKEWKKGGKHGKHGKHKGAGFSKELNITDAQKEQFKALNKDYKSKLKAIRSNDNATVGDVKKQTMALRQEHQSKMQSILTTEQKNKMAELKEKRKAEAKAKGEKRFDQMKKDLNMTDAQASKLKAQNEAFRTKAQAIRSNTSLSQDQKKEQFKALAEQHKADMKAVLTAEQLQKMEAKKQEFRSKRAKK